MLQDVRRVCLSAKSWLGASLLTRHFIFQVSSDVAVKLRIIYGGSVNDKNADELASQVWLHRDRIFLMPLSCTAYSTKY